MCEYHAVSGQFCMDYFLEGEAVSRPSVGVRNKWKVNGYTTGNQAVSVVESPSGNCIQWPPKLTKAE